MSFAKRFIGVESLPSRLSEYDVREAFALSQGDVATVRDRFRHDRHVAAAIQMPAHPDDLLRDCPSLAVRAPSRDYRFVAYEGLIHPHS